MRMREVLLHVIYSDHTPLFRVICKATYARERDRGKSSHRLRGQIISRTASFPGSCAVEEEESLVHTVHCSCMCRVPLVTCIVLDYTKIMANFCLHAERVHSRVILPVRHTQVIVKSKTVSL